MILVVAGKSLFESTLISFLLERVYRFGSFLSKFRDASKLKTDDPTLNEIVHQSIAHFAFPMIQSVFVGFQLVGVVVKVSVGLDGGHVFTSVETLEINQDASVVRQLP